MGIRSYKDLKVWQAGMRLCTDMYKVTAKLPDTEKFGLISQMRRAAVSVPANIAEGYQRQHDNELRQFLHISLGSLAELETYLHLCGDMDLLSQPSVTSLLAQSDEVGKMLRGLVAKTRESAR